MSKPVRIVRRVPQATDNPSASEPAATEAHSNPNACRICGVYVIDTELHKQFHADIYKVSVWMWRVNNELLRSAPDREDVPNAGETIPCVGDEAREQEQSTTGGGLA